MASLQGDVDVSNCNEVIGNGAWIIIINNAIDMRTSQPINKTLQIQIQQFIICVIFFKGSW